MSKRKEIENSHAAELASYLKYKKRVFESHEISNTDSFASEGEIKRKRTLNYFGGKGEKKWDPKSMFVIDNLNVTNRLKKFRSRNVVLAEEVNGINPLRVLSLSHIFTIDKFDNARCISYYCDTIKSKIHEYAYKDIEMKKVSMEAMYYCKQIMDTIDEGDDTEDVEYKPTDAIDIHLKEIVLEFIEVVAESNLSLESTFMDKFIMPLLRKTVLKKPNVVYSVIDGYDKKPGNKPDGKIGFRDKNKVIDVVYFEVKKPGITSKDQAESDYVKLLKQLKVSIDFQVKLNIISPVAFGILCEGFDCSLIQMKLVEDGIYLATNLMKFKLPKDHISLLDIPRVVECFEYVTDELQKLQSRYKERAKKQVTIEHEYVKNSFITEFE